MSQETETALWADRERLRDQVATLQRELAEATRAQNDLHDEISVLRQQIAHAQSCERSMREAIQKALAEISGGLCYFTAEAKHCQLRDAQRTLQAVVDGQPAPKPPRELEPQRCFSSGCTKSAMAGSVLCQEHYYKLPASMREEDPAPKGGSHGL